MKSLSRFCAVLIFIGLTLISAPANLFPYWSNASSARQASAIDALQRGYRTGYSDGYQAGWQDSTDRASRNYRDKEDYKRADRAYVESYGPMEDYRDGYQQGFEAGYEDGYSKRTFNSDVPTNLTRRGISRDREDETNRTTSSASRNESIVERSTESTSSIRIEDRNSSSSRRADVSIPTNTIMRVELLNRLSSDVSHRGDRFEARVVEPPEYKDARVSGRVTRVKRPGKLRGTAELELSFEQIALGDGRWENFSAQVIDVVQTGDYEGVGRVDEEGGVRGRDSTKDDTAKVGAGAGIGAIIGAIAGGGKGAAIGAIIGGGAATGGVLAQRGKDIRLEPGQQILIRTATNTQFE